MKKYFGFIIILLISSVCVRNKNPLSPSDTSIFSIFLLKDPNITYQQAEEQNLDQLEIQNEPWLSSDDISMYDFSTHFMYLKNDKDSLFKDMVDDLYVFNDFLLKPFIMVANHERIYLGCFISSLSSVGCTGPNIRDIEQLFYPTDIVPIRNCDIEGWSDDRNDSRIRSALSELNLFHAGLTVTLNSVNIIENSDTSTISYSFTIYNNDHDNLLIPDPDLMGSELFHYYTNGIDFWSSDNKYYYSQYKEVTAPNPNDNWDPSWFSELKSNHSIQRTVHLKGYPQMPAGTYRGYFKYSGPSKIDRTERINQNCRYWLGDVKSNTISINVN